jgi:hypothetical protein
MLLFSFSFVSAADINITSPINNSKLTSTSFNINYTIQNYINTSNSSCWYVLDSLIPQNITCSNNNFLISSIDGVHNIILYINDNGVLSNSTIKFNIDSQIPLVTITYPLDGIYYNTPRTLLNFTVTDVNNISSCWLSNGSIIKFVSCNGINLIIEASMSRIGLNAWTVYANDSFGNNGSQTISFTYDVTPPVFENLSVYPNHDFIRIYFKSNESVNTTVKYSSDYTNLNNTEYESGFSTSQNIYLESLLNATTYYYRIIICDRSGNCFTNPDVAILTTITDPDYTCNTTYNCSNWGTCQSDGNQIRSCTKLISGCNAPIVPVRQSCVYINPNPILTSTVSSNITNSTSSGTGSGVGSTIILVCVCIVVIGLIVWLIWWLYSIYSSRPKRSSGSSLYENYSSDDINKFLDDQENN